MGCGVGSSRRLEICADDRASRMSTGRAKETAARGVCLSTRALCSVIRLVATPGDLSMMNEGFSDTSFGTPGRARKPWLGDADASQGVRHRWWGRTNCAARSNSESHQRAVDVTGRAAVVDSAQAPHHRFDTERPSGGVLVSHASGLAHQRSVPGAPLNGPTSSAVNPSLVEVAVRPPTGSSSSQAVSIRPGRTRGGP